MNLKAGDPVWGVQNSHKGPWPPPYSGLRLKESFI